MSKQVTASLFRKVSDGNYGSLEVGFSVTDDVHPDEKISTAMNRVYDYVETMLNIKLEENGIA